MRAIDPSGIPPKGLAILSANPQPEYTDWREAERRQTERWKQHDAWKALRYENSSAVVVAWS